MGSADAATAQDRAWQHYIQEVRAGTGGPFEAQWARFEAIFSGRRPDDGPPPVWQPAPHGEGSNLGQLLRELGCRDYPALHRWSVTERAAFWGAVIERLGIVYAHPPDRLLDVTGGVRQARWLPGATLNIVDSCFTAPADAPAVVSATETAPGVTVTTYGALERLVNRIANGLREHGFQAGEPIALYMPMTLECVATYLAIVRAGMCVVSIADSFSPAEVARRCELTRTRCVVTVAAYQRAGRAMPLYEKVCQAGVAQAIVVPQADAPVALRPGDLTFDDLLSTRTKFTSAVRQPDDPINLLFSSGTTGTPKAIPWTQLTPIKCAMDGRWHQDVRAGDVVAWPTNIGWMMGPWLIFATLLNDATMALFEGAPTGAGFTRFVEESGVTILGVVPSLVRAWRSADAIGADAWRRVRVFSSTGEPSSRRDALWLMSRTGYRAPIIEYLGGTEIGGGHLTGTVVHPASPATFTTPALGIDFVILDEAGRAVGEGETGELFLMPPAIGLSQTLLGHDHDEVYYGGCPPGPGGAVLRRHGDEIARLPRGYYRAQGRADDTMNLGGIKVSAVELERVIETHETVHEAAAVGVQAGDEGASLLVVFAVLRPHTERTGLCEALQARIAAELNPLFKIHELVVVDELPRTASNKLMRRQLRAQHGPAATRMERS